MSGTVSESLSPSHPERRQHLPPRFLELERRVLASEEDPEAEPVYFGKFKLIRLLGSGGFGLVFLAHDQKLNRWVAVKVCPIAPRETDSASPEARSLMGFEARMLAMFNHPNIVTVYEVGVHDGDVFYAMEYIEGCDGGEFIRRWRSWRAAVAVYEAAATGLAAAHARGIVHGDFKPENVLIGEGRVCVADFGLAQLINTQPVETTTRESHRLGTLPYMAPELLQGKPASPATDQWALCVALWETLYGRRPFAGGTVAALRDSINRGLPMQLGLLPRSIDAVLRRGLSLDPADRYPSMQALIDALWKARTSGGTVGDPHHASKRRNGFALAVGLACGAALGAFGWALRSGTVEPVPMAERELADAAEPSEPETSPSPCVLDDTYSPAELDSRVIAVCVHIRKNEIDEAHKLWKLERKARIEQHDELVALKQGDAVALAAALTADTDIIAQTFADQAKRLQLSNSKAAALASNYAVFWMTGAGLTGQLDDDQP